MSGPDSGGKRQATQLESMWPALCALVAGAGGSVFCTTLWGRTGQARTLLVTLLLAGLGAALGLLLRSTRGRRIASAAACIMLFAAGLVSSRYLSSDSYLCRKDWPVHAVGITRFAYPSLTWTKVTEGTPVPDGTVSMYTNENMNRYVCAFAYDFTTDNHELADTVTGAVGGMLKGFNGEFKGWSNVPEYTDNSVRARFTYVRNGRAFTGIAFGAQEGTRYEIVMFFPLRKQYSEPFMQKLESSLTAD